MSQMPVPEDVALPFGEAADAALGLDPSNRRLFTVLEVAQLLNIGRTKVFHLMAAGQLQSVRIGRLRRVPAEAVEAYVQSLVRADRG